MKKNIENNKPINITLNIGVSFYAKEKEGLH